MAAAYSAAEDVRRVGNILVGRAPRGGGGGGGMPQSLKEDFSEFEIFLTDCATSFSCVARVY